jgi:glycosyltransferase involved in cell wall biosynthesis
MENAMKVLFVSKYPPNQSGEAEYLKEILEETTLTSSCSISILTWRNEVNSYHATTGLNIKYKLYSKETVLRWLNPLIIIFEMFLSRPDVIHYQSSFEKSLGGFCGEAVIISNIIARVLGVKTIISYHSAGLPVFGKSILSKIKILYWIVMAKIFVRSFDTINIVTAFNEKEYFNTFLKAMSRNEKNVSFENHFFYSDSGLQLIKRSGGNIKVKYCGFIRPDKGLDLFVEALKLIKYEIDVAIVGHTKSDLDNQFIERAIFSIENVKNVKSFYVKNEFLTTNNFKSEVKNCDILVIPYKMLSSVSGPAMMGVSFGKRVVTTPVGIFSMNNPNLQVAGVFVADSISEIDLAKAINLACLDVVESRNCGSKNKQMPDVRQSFKVLESLYLEQYN